MNLGELNNWLQYKPLYPIKTTIVEHMYNSFQRYIKLLESLGFSIKNIKNFEKHYVLFLSMYSLKKFPIKKHSQFYTDKDIHIFNSFGTFYGETLARFIEDEKTKFRNNSLDILQKQNFSLSLEFIIFTMKRIELDNIQLLQ